VEGDHVALFVAFVEAVVVVAISWEWFLSKTLSWEYYPDCLVGDVVGRVV
jgi:hypothetical protein